MGRRKAVIDRAHREIVITERACGVVRTKVLPPELRRLEARHLDGLCRLRRWERITWKLKAAANRLTGVAIVVIECLQGQVIDDALPGHRVFARDSVVCACDQERDA